MLPDGRVLITGGAWGGSAELYDPTAGLFAFTGSMGITRLEHTATLLRDGKVLIVGGGNGGNVGLPDFGIATATSELYDPATGLFTPKGNMTTARSGHTATLLGDGKVLIAGGVIAGGSCQPMGTDRYRDRRNI